MRPVLIDILNVYTSLSESDRHDPAIMCSQPGQYYVYVSLSILYAMSLRSLPDPCLSDMTATCVESVDTITLVVVQLFRLLAWRHCDDTQRVNLTVGCIQRSDVYG